MVAIEGMNKQISKKKEMHEVMIEVWKDGKELIIFNRLTGKRMFLQIQGVDYPGTDYDTDFSYGGNGYQRVRQVEDIFVSDKKSEVTA